MAGWRRAPSAQDEHELGNVFAYDLDALLALEAEAALFQDANRADVVLDHVRVEGMLLDGVLAPVDGRLHPDPSRPGLGLELRRQDTERFRR